MKNIERDVRCQPMTIFILWVELKIVCSADCLWNGFLLQPGFHLGFAKKTTPQQINANGAYVIEYNILLKNSFRFAHPKVGQVQIFYLQRSDTCLQITTIIYGGVHPLGNRKCGQNGMVWPIGVVHCQIIIGLVHRLFSWSIAFYEKFLDWFWLIKKNNWCIGCQGLAALKPFRFQWSRQGLSHCTKIDFA